MEKKFSDKQRIVSRLEENLMKIISTDNFDRDDYPNKVIASDLE